MLKLSIKLKGGICYQVNVEDTATSCRNLESADLSMFFTDCTNARYAAQYLLNNAMKSTTGQYASELVTDPLIICIKNLDDLLSPTSQNTTTKMAHI